MKRYTITLPEFTVILYHETDFSEEELAKMVSQTISEMKWKGIRRTYVTEANYMIDHFGFWEAHWE